MEFDVYILVSTILNVLIEFYIIGKFLKKDFVILNNKNIIFLILITLYQMTVYMLTNNFIRPILSLLAIILCAKKVFNENWSKSVICSFMAWFIILISEVIMMIFINIIIGYDINQIQEQKFMKLLFNMLILFISIFIVNIRPLMILIRDLFKGIGFVNYKFLTLMIFLIVTAFTIEVYLIFFNVSPILSLILNLSVMIIYFFVLISYFTEKHANLNMQQNIQLISKNLNEYEKMLDYQRVANHENKNDLLVIKGKIKKKDEDIIEYIDEIIKEKRNDNEDFYNNTKLIPTGGLQGLIYYKCLLMKEKNIDISLNISKEIKYVKFEDFDKKYNNYICKIIGVWIDNSIQAVEKLNDKNICIEMSCEDSKLIIRISNNFSGVIDIEKISNEGYTTKGKEHGYGLCLVKKILNETSDFKNIIKVNGNIFIQELQVSIK